MAQLLYQGHGSYRIITQGGTVIYVDPFVGEGYDLPADLILVTHEHLDHNRVHRVSKKQGTRVIRAADALKDGVYGTFEFDDVKIEAVEAYNRNHGKDSCVGYILTMDNVSLYASGDTSETERMKSLKARGLDWALLPIDGIFNMNAAEASRCADLIGAKHTVPVHMKPGGLFDQKKAEGFHCSGRVIIEPGETVDL
jgi:L-ascorbate metabolism protein UlaG (beta-lactamase superfamily)